MGYLLKVMNLISTLSHPKIREGFPNQSLIADQPRGVGEGSLSVPPSITFGVWARKNKVLEVR